MTVSGASRFPRLIQRFDPFDPEFEEHFFEVADELREQCPVAHSDTQGGFWTFSRFADVLNGFANDDCFTDTTAHTLGNMLATLTGRPELLRRLVDQPQLLPRAIDELLRWEPPAGGLVRTARHDIVVGGRQLRAGDPILLLVAAANRDPAEFDAADTVDFDATGRGISPSATGPTTASCVHLARLELRVALEELLRGSRTSGSTRPVSRTTPEALGAPPSSTFSSRLGPSPR